MPLDWNVFLISHISICIQTKHKDQGGETDRNVALELSHKTALNLAPSYLSIVSRLEPKK